MVFSPPKHWPKTIPYSPISFCDEIELRDLRMLLFPPKKKSHSELIEKHSIHPDLEIRVLTRPHLLEGVSTNLGHKSRGLFAKRRIGPRVLLGEYVGKMNVSDKVEKKSGFYEYAWVISHPHFVLTVDAMFGANELAFVNDYRNIASGPNITPVFFAHGSVHYFCYQTLRSVNVGEELLIDYDAAFWKKGGSPLF